MNFEEDSPGNVGQHFFLFSVWSLTSIQEKLRVVEEPSLILYTHCSPSEMWRAVSEDFFCRSSSFLEIFIHYIRWFLIINGNFSL